MVFKEKRVIILIIVVLAVFFMANSFRANTEKPIAEAYVLPLVFGSWEGTDLTYNRKLLTSWLGTDFITFRNYKNSANGSVVTLYIAYYPDLESSDMAHSPEVCYPGQGWEITKGEDTEIILQGKKVNIKRLYIKKESEQQVVYSWWQTEHKIIAENSWYHLYQILSKVSHRDTSSIWIRISTESTKGLRREISEEKVLIPFSNDIMDLLANYFKH
ncbi:MAG TPA: EpsI family protein [Bacteroidales bacterium]|nr:EpsI family protein [Bacteroidales bacterium]